MRLLPCSYHGPRQGRATIHVHRGFPCRPEHTCRVREEPKHTYTSGLFCQPDRTRQVAYQGGAATQVHMWPTLLASSNSLKCVSIASSIFIQGTTNLHNLILKGMVSEKQPKELSTITGGTRTYRRIISNNSYTLKIRTPPPPPPPPISGKRC